MRRRRCLLVLDNAEAVVAEGEHAGRYRTGFAGYGELLRCVGESSHQSCLLITSREALHELPMLHGVDRPVRVLYLSSLSHAGSCALLAQKGLSGKPQSWAALTSWYSGNPLVLQFVGETIRELFQGSIDRFLQHERALFSGVRELLAGQFARLGPLEQDVVVWLALHCGPVPPEVLAVEIEPAPNWAALLDALHSLRKRSMVEQGERGFMLQNVVMEFVTVHFVEQLTQEISTHEDWSQTAIAQGRLHLKHYALLNTQERQHVRDSQTRLVLEPIVERLVSLFGKSGAEERLRRVLSSLRQDRTLRPDYGGGNVLNLLIHLNGHLRGEDFSGLTVRHAALQGIQAQDANFRGTHLDKCDFSLAFNTVLSLAFSPTGDHLAIGSDTGLFCMRRVRGEFPLNRLMTPSRVVWATCFSPDGSLIAGAGIDGTVRIWATESGRCLQSLTGHTGAVWALCFSPDGRLVASGGTDSSIRFWDVQGGHCLATVAEHTQGVRGLCFSPGGDILASASEDGTVRLWTGQQIPEQVRCVQILQEHSGMAWAVDISPDGAHLATGGHDRTVRLYAADSGRLLKTLAGHTHYITQVCFHSDSSLLASSSYDGTVRLWDTGSGQCLRTLQGHTAHVWSAAFSPTDNVLASGSEDLSVRLWDVARPGGSGQCLKTLRGYTNSLYATSFSPDGSLVAGGGHDLLVRLWDPLTGNCLAALAGHTGSIWDVTFSPDGQLLVSAGHDRIARMWDVASGRCVYEIETAEGCHATSFHPHAKVLATANLDGTLDVWNVHNWNLITTLRGHTAEVWAISFSPDGRLVASGSMDNSVRLWDWHSGECLQTLYGHTSYVRAVNFSPDGALWPAAVGTAQFGSGMSGICLSGPQVLPSCRGRNMQARCL